MSWTSSFGITNAERISGDDHQPAAPSPSPDPRAIALPTPTPPVPSACRPFAGSGEGSAPHCAALPAALAGPGGDAQSFGRADGSGADATSGGRGAEQGRRSAPWTSCVSGGTSSGGPPEMVSLAESAGRLPSRDLPMRSRARGYGSLVSDFRRLRDWRRVAELPAHVAGVRHERLDESLGIRREETPRVPVGGDPAAQ